MTRPLTLIAATLVAAPAVAQCEPSTLGLLGGLPQDLVADGGLTTIANQYGSLYVVDTLSGGNPEILGTIATPGRTYDLDVEGGIAAVAGSQGLVLIDKSDPANLSVLSTYVPDGLDHNNSLRGVVLVGDIAYITEEDGLLHVLDITDPTSPSLMTTLDLDFDAGQIFYDHYSLFIVLQQQYIGVVDVFRPEDPLYLYAAHGFFSGVETMSMADGVLYGCLLNGDLVVADFSDPTNPQEVADFDADAAWSVASGDYVYVSVEAGGVDVYDLGGDEPALVGSYGAGGQGGPIDIEGDTVSLGIRVAGLDVVDVTEPSAPTLLGGFRVPASSSSLVVADGLAYLADADLAIIDVSDPASPGPGATIQTPGGSYPDKIAVDAGLAALIAFNDLQICDVADPSNPVYLGELNVGIASSIALSGDVAFVGISGSMLAVDVSDPANPVAVGSFGTPNGTVRDVRIVGDLAYLSVSNAGLRIVDVSDPASMQAVGLFAASEVGALDVDADAAVAYLFTSTFDDLYAINVADPSDPMLLGQVEVTGNVSDLSHDGTAIALVDELAGVSVVDAADPADMRLLATSPLVIEPLGVQLVGTTAHVASPYQGYVSIDLSSCVGGCPADINGDGVLNVLDFVAFQLLWNDQDPSADCDDNGAFNVLDFVCYSQLFAAGCD